MRKIKTIFKRNESTRKVINELDVEFNFDKAIATEKVDGTNIRVTVRSNTVVRVEKRCNPSKEQKSRGIIEPWYKDASVTDSGDKYIFKAVNASDFSDIPDGEWSCEAYGENIQGNPLNIEGNKLFMFSVESKLRQAVFLAVPTNFADLNTWLNSQQSKIGCGLVEGIVWHSEDGNMVKIKRKDF